MTVIRFFTLFDADVSNTELSTESGAERRSARRKGSSGEVSVVSFGANIGKTEGLTFTK